MRWARGSAGWLPWGGRGWPAWNGISPSLIWIPLALLLPWNSLHGQDRMSWAVLPMLGYGGFGCVVGYAAGKEATREALGRETAEPGAVVVGVGGCIAGGKIGQSLGREVDRILSRGEDVPTGLRRGIQLGTVLTGATAGTLLSLVPAGLRDEGRTEIVLAGALVGAVGGFIAQLSLNKHLDPVETAPSLAMGRGPVGGFSVAWVFRF